MRVGVMPYWRFQATNFISAFVGAAGLRTLGDGVATIFKLIWP
jgi:membrane protein DedA with SNARE-associated domain